MIVGPWGCNNLVVDSSIIGPVDRLRIFDNVSIFGDPNTPSVPKCFLRLGLFLGHGCNRCRVIADSEVDCAGSNRHHIADSQLSAVYSVGSIQGVDC